MLSTLNMTANDGNIEEVVNRIAKDSDTIDKQASIQKNSKECMTNVT